MPDLEAPLFTRPIHGARAWEVIESERDGPLLGAWAVGQVWPPGEVYRASCIATTLRGGRPWPPRTSRAPHLAPHPSCSCGIYALHPGHLATRGELVERLERCDAAGVIGVVEAWGRIEVHRQGFRAARARPVAFYACGATGELALPGIERLARAYGARVVEVEDELALVDELAGLEGLQRETVRGLLGETRELVLEPYREVVTDRAGRTLVRTGFRPTRRLDVKDEWEGRGRPQHLVVPVVGAARHPALQGDAFNLCREVRLELVRTDGTRTRAHVLDASGSETVGRVPTKLVPAVRRMMREGGIARALVAGHARSAATGPRRALEVLLTPHRRIALRVGRPPCHVPLEKGENLF